MSELKQYLVYIIKYNNDIIYIGSTSNFRYRKSKHKLACYNEDGEKYNKKLYKHIRENDIDFEDLKFEIIEYIENKFSSDKENEKEARKREEQYRKRYSEITGGNITNMLRAYRTDEELKEYHKAYDKQYYENNKERIKEYHKAYNKVKYTCECGSILTVHNKVRHERSKKHIEYINKH